MKAADAIALLIELIKIPSLSGEENRTGDLLESTLKKFGAKPERIKNNIVAKNKFFDESKPTVLLNSHHDTVNANKQWTYDPHGAIEEGDKLIGLGSNDAGASLVSLMAVFLHFYEIENSPYNLVYAASAEEESSGENGMRFLVNELGKIDFAIVGEPTQMDLAVAEKGLIVVDCYAKGRAGHAARDEGENSIYKAIKDIDWIKNYEFPKVSETLGKIKMTVTVVSAGRLHNVVPDECKFTIDIRTTDCYQNEEIVKVLKENLQSEVVPRSVILNSSGVNGSHPIIDVAKDLSINMYGSPTLSDQSLMPWESVKMGPGDSARSHTADEYILKSEIEKGIDIYIKVLEELEIRK